MTQPSVSIAAAARARRRGLLLSERKLLLGAGDVAAVAIAFLTAFNLRTAQVRHLNFAVPRVALGIAVVIFLVSAYLADGYNLVSTVSLRGTVRIILISLSLAFLGLLGVFFVVPYRITRPTLLLWLPLSVVTLACWRLLYRQFSRQDIFAGRLVILADPAALSAAWPGMAASMAGLYSVVEVIDPSTPDSGARLAELVASDRVDQVILGVRDQVSRDLFRTLVDCYNGGTRVRSVTDVYEDLTGRLLLDQLGHSWLLALPMRSETSRLYSAFKRGLDVFAAIVGLLLLFVVAALAWLVNLATSRGPLFHRQVRVGKYGHEFEILKLRTMDPAGGAGEWTGERDPRVTVAGRVMRRLHVDELAQAWNILKGDMSVIGPRPEQPQYVEMLRGAIDFYDTRLSVRPGLTGWAQINYGYGSGVEGGRVKLSYDLYYIKRQSVALDLLILARTAFAVVSLGGR